ncbi:MAG: hypothetical protein AAGB24_15635 [Bacteroidota bacterium]
MKTTIKLTFLLLFTFIVFSCSSDDDANNEAVDSELVGEWSGVFLGDDQGTWNITVSESGAITGTGISNTIQELFNFEGRVNLNGELTATFGGTNTGATFIGTLNTNGNGSGNWENSAAQLSGTWEGTKVD